MDIVEDLRDTADRITRYTNSPHDGLMFAAADEIDRLLAEVAELRKDAERYRMKRLIDFKAAKATNEDRWNKGYDTAVDYCIKHGTPTAIDVALAKEQP